KEALQLEGLHPWLLEDRKRLEDFLRAPPIPSVAAILVDGIPLTGEELPPLLDRLEMLQRPVLLCTRLTAAPDFNPHHWISLPRLGEKQIRDFLATSVRNFPAATDLQPLLRLTSGNLSKLEDLFQAMAEEGLLQWSEQGWSWIAEREIPLDELLPRSE